MEREEYVTLSEAYLAHDKDLRSRDGKQGRDLEPTSSLVQGGSAPAKPTDKDSARPRKCNKGAKCPGLLPTSDSAHIPCERGTHKPKKAPKASTQSGEKKKSEKGGNKPSSSSSSSSSTSKQERSVKPHCSVCQKPHSGVCGYNDPNSRFYKGGSRCKPDRAPSSRRDRSRSPSDRRRGYHSDRRSRSPRRRSPSRSYERDSPPRQSEWTWTILRDVIHHILSTTTTSLGLDHHQPQSSRENPTLAQTKGGKDGHCDEGHKRTQDTRQLYATYPTFGTTSR